MSLIEAALKISDNKIKGKIIEEIIRLGKDQINRKNELFPDVEKVLKNLSQRYRLIVATKGDLLDQERKLRNSGLLGYFHHIEIMSDKKTENYRQLLNHLDIGPQDFLMVGNSLKSDIIPVIELGGKTIHIPYHITWDYEKVPESVLPESHYIKINSISEIVEIL